MSVLVSTAWWLSDNCNDTSEKCLVAIWLVIAFAVNVTRLAAQGASEVRGFVCGTEQFYRESL